MDNIPGKTTQSPELVTIGTKQVISTRRWNDEIVIAHVISNGRSKWVTVNDLASLVYGYASKLNQQRIRERLYKACRGALERGHLFVVDTGSKRKRAQAIKLLNPASEMECKLWRERLDKMHQRKQLTDEQFARADALWNAQIDAGDSLIS